MNNKNFEDDDFIKDFEDWHNHKYRHVYRHGNKTPFFFKNPNYLKNGILFLIIPFLSLAISIGLGFGVGFYLFFFLLCLPGIYQIIKHFKSK